MLSIYFAFLSLQVHRCYFLKKERKNIFVFATFFVITISLYFYGSNKLSKISETEFNKNDYKIRVVSSNISIDRFYNNLDPISVIKDLIEISSPQKKEKQSLFGQKVFCQEFHKISLLNINGYSRKSLMKTIC